MTYTKENLVPGFIFSNAAGENVKYTILTVNTETDQIMLTHDSTTTIPIALEWLNRNDKSRWKVIHQPPEKQIVYEIF